MATEVSTAMDLTIKISDVAIVIATLVGPILAVQAQKWLERGREIKQRRAWIFRTLMATRATNLSQAHVEALNAIPIEFYGKSTKLKEIINAWKAYLAHLGQGSTATEVWSAKREDLLVDLLHLMAEYLGYDFNRVEISKEVYSPQGHAQIESDQEIIRKGLAGILSGKVPFPMEVTKFPIDPAALQEQKLLRELLLNWLKGQQSVKIELNQEAKKA